LIYLDFVEFAGVSRLDFIKYQGPGAKCQVGFLFRAIPLRWGFGVIRASQDSPSRDSLSPQLGPASR
jgi:hypothetical protein